MQFINFLLDGDTNTNLANEHGSDIILKKNDTLFFCILPDTSYLYSWTLKDGIQGIERPGQVPDIYLDDDDIRIILPMPDLIRYSEVIGFDYERHGGLIFIPVTTNKRKEFIPLHLVDICTFATKINAFVQEDHLIIYDTNRQDILVYERIDPSLTFRENLRDIYGYSSLDSMQLSILEDCGIKRFHDVECRLGFVSDVNIICSE